MLSIHSREIVSAHLFCPPKVSVFCQGQVLYFVKSNGSIGKQTDAPDLEATVSDIREQLLLAKSHEALRSLPSVALSSTVGKSP